MAEPTTNAPTRSPVKTKDEVLALLDEMPTGECQAIYAAWEAQRPILELAVGTPHALFVSCWLAARAYYATKPDPEPRDSPIEINDGLGI
ncbi:MAG TPA: hypothetical protein VGN13_12230 [Solirubrobacteraceae bacterium]|jgi:hypothetical protein